MTNYTAVRPGQVNGAGDANALFLQKFGGEVLVAFADSNVMNGRHVVRTISEGKSASFPATWKVTASYHTPGNEIAGQNVNHNERVITIDDLLIAPVFIPKIDEAKAHYDVRSIYTRESGQALADQYDKNLFQVGILAARAAATVTGGSGGTQLTNSNYRTDGSVLATGIFDARQTLDEKNIPARDTYCFIKPAQYYLLVRTTNTINKDWGGQGSYAEGKVLKIADVEIVKSTHLPTSNVTTGPTAYQGDFTNTAALVMHKMAIGTVKLLDLAMDMEYSARHQGTLIVSKYAVGHGILRPECSVELKVL